MQYDRLAEAAEKHFPEWRKAVEDARLFVLDEDRHDKPSPTEEAKRAMRNWEPDETLIENFRLPFETVAIESRGCCLLQTIDAASRTFRALIASETSREVLLGSCHLTAFPGKRLCVDQESVERAAEVKDLRIWGWSRGTVEECMFSMEEARGKSTGRDVELAIVGDGLSFDGRLYSRREAKKVAGDWLPHLRAQSDVTRARIGYLESLCAVWLALRIMEPASFIVEHKHVDFVPREPKTGKVIRSPYRPHYIVLTPGEIRRRFIRDNDGEAIPSGMTRRPHERRGHYRKLTSEKYVAKRNHVIWIKPCWVGKTEGVVGKNRYVVRLDL